MLNANALVYYACSVIAFLAVYFTYDTIESHKRDQAVERLNLGEF